MKRTIKIISIILTVIMFFSVFSAANPVIAAEVQEKEEAENSVKTLVENLQEENKTNALTEIIDERDRYTKVFKT